MDSILIDEGGRNAHLQVEEWEVMEAIYPDCVSNDPSKGIKSLEILVEFGEERTVHIAHDGTNVTSTGSSESESTRALSLLSLPPILLQFILPETYPSTAPPSIVSLHATNSWLTPRRINQLKEMLVEMWQPGEGVLYTWVEWIRSAGFLGALDLLSVGPVGRNVIRLPSSVPHRLATHLANHDARSKSSQFAQTSYTCSICISTLKGARCLQLDCRHVFCRSCLDDFWSTCITEGDVGRVGCPSPECVKERREAGEEEVRRAVTEEKVVRWKWLKRKRAIEQDPTVINCPLLACQEPVPETAGMMSNGSGWDRLRTCQSCGYSFCSFCKRTWHGPISECPIPAFEKFVEEYMSLLEDSPSRLALEQRHGKATLERLVLKCEEDKANRLWLENRSMSCPNCQVHVEKSHGCNHMTCSRCRENFCYRCGERLDRNNPYDHFSDPNKRCHSKLFDYDDVEDVQHPVEGYDDAVE